MFRRLIITWLVVSILGYGMALAADLHAGLATDPSHVLGDHATGSDAHVNDADGGCCDHCCHGAAHLLGLKRGDTFELPAERGVFPLSPAVSSTSFLPPSPLRPPITS